MSTVIQFLESMGSNASSSRLTAAGYAQALASLEVSPEARAALLQRDPAVLNTLLGGRNKILFALLPVDPDKKGDEQPLDEPVQPDQKTPAEPDRN